jgi:hypothetical protein
MANYESTKSVTPTPIAFESNGIGSIVIRADDLKSFAKQKSTQLASMLHVLMQTHQEIDGGFMTDILEIANDLAFQVQQAAELMASCATAEVFHV